MSAMSHEFGLASVGAERDSADYRALAERWEAVIEAAQAVAALAGISYQPHREAGFARRAAACDAAVYGVAARGIGDLAAVLQPGVRALLALTAAERDCRAAALALWREFESTRDSLLSLVDGPG